KRKSIVVIRECTDSADDVVRGVIDKFEKGTNMGLTGNLRLMLSYGDSGKLWLMGIANSQTYLSCKIGNPSLETLWDNTRNCADSQGKDMISRELAAVVLGSKNNFIPIENASRIFFMEDVDQVDYHSQMGIKKAIESGTIPLPCSRPVHLEDAIIILSCKSFTSSSKACSPIRQKHNENESDMILQQVVSRAWFEVLEARLILGKVYCCWVLKQQGFLGDRVCAACFDVQDLDNKGNSFKLGFLFGGLFPNQFQRKEGFFEVRFVEVLAVKTNSKVLSSRVVDVTDTVKESLRVVDFAIWWDTLKLEDVLATLNSRELKRMTKAKGDGGKGLYVRRRSGQRDIEQGTYSAWSKSHERSNRLRNKDQVFGSGTDGYDNVDVMMAMNVEELLDWIMDSRGSYHITYKRDYLVDFEEYDGGNILLGDGRECRVRETSKGFTVKMQSGKITVIKGSLVVLSRTRRANCVYTLDGQAMTRKTLKGTKQLVEYQTGWKINTSNVLDSCNQRSTQQCTKSGVAKHLGVAGLQQQNGLVKETNMTLLAKTPIDMFAFFGWLASIEHAMLEPVKVKCIFLGFHESIVGNKLLRLDDVTSMVVLYRNMGFNESGEYKKTFIGFGVGTCSMQVLHKFEFEVEPLGDHTFEVEPQENVDQGAVAAVEKIYAHESLTFNNTVACGLISKWKVELKDDMDARSDVYVLSNGYRKCSDDNNGYYWEYTPGLLDKAKENVLGMEIVRDQSGNTLRVSQSRFYNGKLVQTLLEGHSILSLEGSLSEDCDVKKNGKWSCIYAVGSHEYQMVCTRLDIASTDVGMLNKFDPGLQTDVKVFVDFDYTMGRSITIMGRSITRIGYITLTEAAKEAIWLKGLAIESGFELKIVAGNVTGALSKAIPGPRFQHRFNFLSIGIG
nr:zinc finger, CCHC-type [Tanacetum cinerariifolium]